MLDHVSDCERKISEAATMDSTVTKIIVKISAAPFWLDRFIWVAPSIRLWQQALDTIRHILSASGIHKTGSPPNLDDVSWADVQKSLGFLLQIMSHRIDI